MGGVSEPFLALLGGRPRLGAGACADCVEGVGAGVVCVVLLCARCCALWGTEVFVG